MAWGKRNAPIVVPMTNERQRQTYYGALNLLTHEFHLSEAPAGNGVNTVAYLQWCQTLYPDKQLFFLWDGASYHRGEDLQKFLAETKGGLPRPTGKLLACALPPMPRSRIRLRRCGAKGKPICASSLP